MNGLCIPGHMAAVTFPGAIRTAEPSSPGPFRPELQFEHGRTQSAGDEPTRTPRCSPLRVRKRGEQLEKTRFHTRLPARIFRFVQNTSNSFANSFSVAWRCRRYSQDPRTRHRKSVRIHNSRCQVEGVRVLSLQLLACVPTLLLTMTFVIQTGCPFPPTIHLRVAERSGSCPRH